MTSLTCHRPQGEMLCIHEHEKTIIVLADKSAEGHTTWRINFLTAINIILARVLVFPYIQYTISPAKLFSCPTARQPKLFYMAQDLAAPLNQKQRILLLDVLRGIALLGILIMNIMAQSQSHFFYDRMDLREPVSNANFYAWAAEMFLFEGTMRGMFSILFGAGALLLLGRLVKSKKGLEPADIYYRRLLWLLLFGLLNAFVLLWPGDILYPYAICGMVLFPFRNLSVKAFLWIALAFLAIGTYRENSDLYHTKNIISKGQAAENFQAKKAKLTDEQTKDLVAYTGYKEKNSKEGIAKAVKEEEQQMQSQNYLTIFRHLVPVNMMLESTIFYKGYWYDILLCFFLGMALFKSGYLLGKKRAWVYALVAVAGIGSGIALNYFYLQLHYRLGFDAILFNQQLKVNYYEIRRVLQTMGNLSLVILLYKVIPFRKILNVFAPVGQMAFTNYLGQSIITSIIFLGFGLYGKLQRYEVYYVVAAIWLFQVIFSNIWLRYFRFGPFEWLWRSLTYWHKQPMKKKAVVEETEEAVEPTPALA